MLKEGLNKLNETLVKKDEIFVEPIDLKVSKKMIVENHYIHKWTPSTVCLGIFKRSDPEPIGTIVYGGICGRPVLSGIFTDSKIKLPNGVTFTPSNSSVLELKRLWIKDGQGYNVESVSISKSIKWLSHHSPSVRVLVSYSDPSVGHRGTVYQSTNWLFQNLYEEKLKTPSTLSSFCLSIKNPSQAKPEEWIHSRTLGHIYGCRSVDKLTRKIGRRFWIRQDVHKFRYLYLLGGKSERELLLRFLKHPVSSTYPKKTCDQGVVQEITPFSG